MWWGGGGGVLGALAAMVHSSLPERFHALEASRQNLNQAAVCLLFFY